MGSCFSCCCNEEKRTGTRKNIALDLDNMNPYLKGMEYSIRDAVAVRASEIERQMDSGVKRHFSSVINANLGDSHALGQKPITSIRQVLALVTCPELFLKFDAPSDVKNRGLHILDSCKGHSIGSYTDSLGIMEIRQHVAAFIQKRDGVSANAEDVILCSGASEGIRSILNIFNTHAKKLPGVLIPIPMYPLFSASLAEFHMQAIEYYLNEEKAWKIEVTELEKKISAAKKICKPRAIVVINPGNPTGHVLTRENIEDVIRFAYKEKLVILADEVHQDNVYALGSKFYSFKKVLVEMGDPYFNLELASFSSVSKGYVGESGVRGGYYEIINFDPQVKALLLKSIAAKLCPNIFGQVVVDCLVLPPKEDDPSYEQFMHEKTGFLDTLAKNAKRAEEALNNIHGVSCNAVQGAVYAYPQITFSDKALEAAKIAGQEPDVFYAFELLETSGVCVIPGSSLGQDPGTYHYRITILLPPDIFNDMLVRIKQFHIEFTARYRE